MTREGVDLDAPIVQRTIGWMITATLVIALLWLHWATRRDELPPIAVLSSERVVTAPDGSVSLRFVVERDGERTLLDDHALAVEVEAAYGRLRYELDDPAATADLASPVARLTAGLDELDAVLVTLRPPPESGGVRFGELEVRLETRSGPRSVGLPTVRLPPGVDLDDLLVPVLGRAVDLYALATREPEPVRIPLVELDGDPLELVLDPVDQP